MGILNRNKIRNALLAAILFLLSACAQGGGAIPGMPDVPSDNGDVAADQQTIPEPPAYAVFSNHYQGVGQ